MKKKLDFGWSPYAMILLGILGAIIFVFGMVSYMSLNNWDIRCIFVECKPVRVIEGEE